MKTNYQAEQTHKRVRQAITKLASFRGDPDDYTAALLSNFYMAKSIVRGKRKDGTASPTSVAKQLRDLGSGTDTLLGRLKKADKNVFEAWSGSEPETRTSAIKEWNQLKWLLQECGARSRHAATVAENVLKLGFGARSAKRGPSEDPVVNVVVGTAGAIYKSATGKRAVGVVNRDTGGRNPRANFTFFWRTCSPP